MTQALVHLVGAGCGDAELLTLKAARIIREATVILVDDLVNEGVLQHAASSAKILHVGKRGGQPSTPQADIEALLVQHALAGEKVVRLKGGDPLIFGRLGEEIAALQTAGIAVEIVNGISAAFAAAADLGVPLTHRHHAHGVVFVTGHARPESEALKWDAVAYAAHSAMLTVVIYMGLAKVETIQREMLKGLPAATPVAIVQNSSLPQQSHAIATLGTLAQTIAAHNLQSPSVIIVGNVLAGLKALHSNPT